MSKIFFRVDISILYIRDFVTIIAGIVISFGFRQKKAAMSQEKLKRAGRIMLAIEILIYIAIMGSLSLILFY